MTALVAGRGREQGRGLADLPTCALPTSKWAPLQAWHRPTCRAAHNKGGSATGLAHLPTCSAAHNKVGSATGERGEGVRA